MEDMSGLTRTNSHRFDPVGLGIQTVPDGREDENILERTPLRPVVKLPIIRLKIRLHTIKPRAVLDPVALKVNEAENPHWRLAFAQDKQSIVFLDTRDCPHLADLAVAREPNWINETITLHAHENWKWLFDIYFQLEPHQRVAMDADKNSEWRKRIAVTLAEYRKAEEDRKRFEASGARRVLTGRRG